MTQIWHFRELISNQAGHLSLGLDNMQRHPGRITRLSNWKDNIQRWYQNQTTKEWPCVNRSNHASRNTSLLSPTLPAIIEQVQSEIMLDRYRWSISARTHWSIPSHSNAWEDNRFVKQQHMLLHRQLQCSKDLVGKIPSNQRNICFDNRKLHTGLHQSD